MSHSNPQVSQAAQAIIALINSRPTSPREDEIAAIIEPAVSGSSSDLLHRIFAAIANGHARFMEAWAPIKTADPSQQDPALLQRLRDALDRSTAELRALKAEIPSHGRTLYDAICHEVVAPQG